VAQFSTGDGCILDYRDEGPADAERTLVLLHGWSQARVMFDRVTPALTTAHRVVSYDQRGHGESGKPENGARIARLAQDLAELLDHLDIRSADVLGHSMGASVLWCYIDLHGTERLDSLIVVDQPSACVVLPWMTADEGAAAGAILDFPGAEGFVRAVGAPDAGATRRAFLESMLSKDLSAAEIDYLYGENLKLSGAWGSRLLLDHVMQDWRDVLPRIDVPTLVVAGEVSHVSPASQAWTADHIPGARLRVFSAAEGGSHFPFFEDPATFAAVLLEFLATLPAPRAVVAVG
jgi:pimeloyl-ACP methyl ester carboxylesterase